MKVLVTGATSGLGRNAVEWLLQAGHQVHATGRNAGVGDMLAAQGAQFTALDLASADIAACRALVAGCDAVWHCAANQQPWGDYQSFYDINVMATENLLQAAGEAGVGRFIYVSSAAIYFDYRHRYNVEEGFRPSRFAGHAVASKYAAEESIRRLMPHYPHICCIILRPGALFGPHQQGDLPVMLENLRHSQGILALPGGGVARSEFTFVLNVVQALALATEQPALESGTVFNITNHEAQSLALMLEMLLGQQLGIQYYLRATPYQIAYGRAGLHEFRSLVRRQRPRVTRHSVAAAAYDLTLSQQRARQTLGYTPRYTLAEGIALTAQWMIAQGLVTPR